MSLDSEIAPPNEPVKVRHPKQKIHLGIEYTFTVNPEGQYDSLKRTSLEVPKRHESVHKSMRKIFAELAVSGVQYYLQMEASEPIGGVTPKKAGSRFHYHGYIKFPTVESLRDFYEYGTVYLTNTSSYEIDTIKDRDAWDEYVNKQSFLGWPVDCTYDYDTSYKKSEKRIKKSKKV